MHAQLTQLPLVHTMLTQHSLFLPTLLESEEEERPDGQVKGGSLPAPPTSDSGSTSSASRQLGTKVSLQSLGNVTKTMLEFLLVSVHCKVESSFL